MFQNYEIVIVVQSKGHGSSKSHHGSKQTIGQNDYPTANDSRIKLGFANVGKPVNQEEAKVAPLRRVQYSMIR
jgi:hypothetical protein